MSRKLDPNAKSEGDRLLDYKLKNYDITGRSLDKCSFEFRLI